MNSYKHNAMQRDYADRGCSMPIRGKQNNCYNENYSYTSYGKAAYSNCKTENINKECSGDMNNFPLAMAYVPWQSFENLNEPYNALECGTLFKDLYLCFGRGCN